MQFGQVIVINLTKGKPVLHFFVFAHPGGEVLAWSSEVKFSCSYFGPCSVSLMITSAGQMVASQGA